jgi:hypothetical protein
MTNEINNQITRGMYILHPILNILLKEERSFIVYNLLHFLVTMFTVVLLFSSSTLLMSC